MFLSNCKGNQVLIKGYYQLHETTYFRYTREFIF